MQLASRALREKHRACGCRPSAAPAPCGCRTKLCAAALGQSRWLCTRLLASRLAAGLRLGSTRGMPNTKRSWMVSRLPLQLLLLWLGLGCTVARGEAAARPGSGPRGRHARALAAACPCSLPIARPTHANQTPHLDGCHACSGDGGARAARQRDASHGADGDAGPRCELDCSGLRSLFALPLLSSCS